MNTTELVYPRKLQRNFVATLVAVLITVRLIHTNIKFCFNKMINKNYLYEHILSDLFR